MPSGQESDVPPVRAQISSFMANLVHSGGKKQPNGTQREKKRWGKEEREGESEREWESLKLLAFYYLDITAEEEMCWT